MKLTHKALFWTFTKLLDRLEIKWWYLPNDYHYFFRSKTKKNHTALKSSGPESSEISTLRKCQEFGAQENKITVSILIAVLNFEKIHLTLKEDLYDMDKHVIKLKNMVVLFNCRHDIFYANTFEYSNCTFTRK